MKDIDMPESGGESGEKMGYDCFAVKQITDFDPRHTFECGQCFRWYREEDGSYTGTALGKIANIRYDGREKILFICCRSREEVDTVWKPYLDIGRDYGALKKQLTETDPVMRKAVDFGGGIHILKQDLWETIVSFLISQNNHIPRIRGCIEKLAELYGRLIDEYRGRQWYALPEPHVLAQLTEEDLAPVRLGYRAKYLLASAKMVAEQGLPENDEQLQSLCGIGPKVAGCVRLFGMGRYDAFPVDVWVARVMHRLYGLEEKDRSGIARFAGEHFGELSGFAQQYLFYYARENVKV